MSPVDDIPSTKTEVGFGGKTEKLKPEQPYKFKVVGVGGPVPIHGVMFRSDVAVGDIISTSTKNSALRENKDSWGFTIDNDWYYVIDFQDVLGFWETNEERQQKFNRLLDAAANAIHRIPGPRLS